MARSKSRRSEGEPSIKLVTMSTYNDDLKALKFAPLMSVKHFNRSSEAMRERADGSPSAMMDDGWGEGAEERPWESRKWSAAIYTSDGER